MPLARFSCLRASQDSSDSESFWCPAVGVGSRPGDDEDPLALVRGSGVGSGYSDPPRVIPEVGQVSENGT
jgi:hypothetical protein